MDEVRETVAGTGPAGRGAAVVHDGRTGLGHGVLRRGRRQDGRRRSRRIPVGQRADRGIHLRLEGIRARADARPPRQRRRGLLDRELRPDGRAHRRFRHRRTGDDADRPRIPDDARPRHRDPARGRRRHRRLQHPVRDRPRRRQARRHRDEPARVAVLGAGVQGHRLPDRQDRSQARDRLHARRDHQRHHQGNPRLLRADARLRRRQGAAVRIREVSRRRPHADHHDEVRRRGDVVGPQLHRGARKGDAVAGDEPHRILDRSRQ